MRPGRAGHAPAASHPRGVAHGETAQLLFPVGSLRSRSAVATDPPGSAGVSSVLTLRRVNLLL